MNFSFPFKSTSEIWKQFNRWFFWKQTNETHQEYVAFLSIRLASFHQQLERGKALEGRDKQARPQWAHAPKLQAALASPARGRDSTASCFSFLIFKETLKLTLWRNPMLQHWQKSNTVLLCVLLLCTQIKRQAVVFPRRNMGVRCKDEKPKRNNCLRALVYAEGIWFLIFRNHQHREQ